MVDECRETRIHGLLSVSSDCSDIGIELYLMHAPLWMERNAFCSRRLRLKLKRLVSDRASTAHGRWSITFVNMVGEDCILKNVEVSVEPSIGEYSHIVDGCERRTSFKSTNNTASLLVEAAALSCRNTCSRYLVWDYKLEGLLKSVPAGSEELPTF